MNNRSDYTSNVVPIRRDMRSIDRPRRDHTADAFDDLTAKIIMQRHARGELEPALLAALLAGIGFSVEAPQ